MCFPWFSPCEQKIRIYCFRWFPGYCLLYMKRDIAHQWSMMQWPEFQNALCDSNARTTPAREHQGLPWPIEKWPRSVLKMWAAFKYQPKAYGIQNMKIHKFRRIIKHTYIWQNYKKLRISKRDQIAGKEMFEECWKTTHKKRNMTTTTSSE